MYLRSSWYVAAWASDLTRTPLARTLLGEQIVLFRTSDGQVAALEDRCPHRHLPLHMGSVVGNAIQCGYHGMQIAPSGKCIHVPSQKAVPPNARVRSYPTAERHGLIWVWTGDPEACADALIPVLSPLGEPGHAAVSSTNHIRANYQLVTDNLMDLSHVGFVHTSTIGNSQMGQDGRIRVDPTPKGIRVTRWVINCPPPPTYVKTGRLKENENIDRWQFINFIAPSAVVIHVGGAPTGTGAPEGRLNHGLNLWVINAMTPRDDCNTDYYWAVVRDYAVDDEAAGGVLFKGLSEAFDEDKRILEAQHAVIDRRGDTWDNAIPADAGSVKARRYLQRLLDEESRVTHTAEIPDHQNVTP